MVEKSDNLVRMLKCSIYVNNEFKFVLAQDFGDCRDKLISL